MKKNTQTAPKAQGAEVVAKTDKLTKAQKKAARLEKTNKTIKDATAAGIVEKITVEKDLKYIYPEDCEKGGTKDELLERRKKFRAGVRRKTNTFEKQVKTLMETKPIDQKAIDKVEKEFKKYAKEVYVNPKAALVA